MYEAMRAEVSFYRRKTGWMGCGWIYLPTFGSLCVVKRHHLVPDILLNLRDNLEICHDQDNSGNCPVYPGRQVLEVKVTPNRLWKNLVKMVHDDRIPYQLKLRLFNNRQPGEELLCVVFQTCMKM